MIDEVKNLAKHVSTYTLGNVLSKVVGFLMIPLYTRYLTPADYGLLELLTLTSSVLSMLIGLRLSSALVRFYSESADEAKRNTLVATIVGLMLLMSTGSAALLSLGSPLVSQAVLGDREHGIHFVFVFISLAFELLLSVGYTYLRVVEKSGLYVAVSLAQLALGLSLNILFIAGMQWGVWGILTSMVLSNGLIALLLLIYTLRRVGLKIRLDDVPRLMRFTLPLIPAGLLIFVLNMGDRFLLGRLTSLDAVGLYSLGYKFGMILSVFVGEPFILAWTVRRVDIYKNRSDRDLIFARVPTYFVAALSFAGLGISMFAPEMLRLVATPEFWPAASVVPWVVIGYAFYILYFVADFGFFIHSKTLWYPVISGSSAAVNVLLNLILIPRFGVLGAAITTAISFFVCLAITYFASQKYHPIHYEFGRMAKLLTVATVLYLVGRLVFPSASLLSAFPKALLLGSFPLLVVLTGFFEPGEVAKAKALWSQRWSVSRQ